MFMHTSNEVLCEKCLRFARLGFDFSDGAARFNGSDESISPKRLWLWLYCVATDN